MFRNKKGDMTLNIIIAAAIAMVVLVVMLLIFTGRIQIFNQPCSGEWKYPDECGQDGFNPTCQIIGTFRDAEPGKVCCKTDIPECRP
jgi:hypothetical protein